MIKSIAVFVKTIWNFLGSYRKSSILVVLLSLAYSLLEAFGIVVLIPVIELVTQASEVSSVTLFLRRIFGFFGASLTLELALLFVLLFFLVKSFLQFLAAHFTVRTTESIRARSIEELFESFAGADWQYFASRSGGGLLNLVLWETANVAHLLKQLLRQTTYLIYTGVFLLVALTISLKLTVIFLLFLAVLSLAMVKMASRFKKLGTRIVGSNEMLSELLTQYLAGLKNLRVYGVHGSARGRVKNEAWKRADSVVRSVDMDVGLNIFTELYSVALLVAFLFAAVTFRWNLAEIGVIAAFMFRMMQQAKQLRGLATLGEQLPSLLLLESTTADFQEHRTSQAEGLPSASFEHDIHFRNVSFSYESRGKKPILKKVDFSVKKGEAVGIIGESGAGKSTLVGLLLGLLTPSEGRIEVDGTPLNRIDLNSWHKLCGYVPQEPFLLNGSIFENIVFLRPEINRADVEKAARAANIDNFISSLPEGYETIVGENGVELSGGERQRICLARALAGDPRILVLDEATSAVDPDSESLVLETLRTLRHERELTKITISHRMSTLVDSDRVLSTERGWLIERAVDRSAASVEW